MFLNENYDFMNESVDNVQSNLEGAMSVNYNLSEEYHSLVESMIIAEHTAIVNEDVNLLSEASNSFLKKIADMFRNLGKRIKAMWENFVVWFKSMTMNGKKFVEKFEARIKANAAAGKAIKVKGYPYAKDPFDVCKPVLTEAINKMKFYGSMAKDPSASAAKLPTQVGLDKELDAIFGKVSTKNKYSKDSSKYADDLKAVIRGAEEKKDIVLRSSQVGMFVNAVKKYDLSKAQKPYNDTIKVYNDLANAFDTISAEYARNTEKVTKYNYNSGKTSAMNNTEFNAKEDKTSKVAENSSKGYSLVAGMCRKISSGLNLVLGVASACAKERYSMCLAFCKAAANNSLKDESKIKKESADFGSILDNFAL